MNQRDIAETEAAKILDEIARVRDLSTCTPLQLCAAVFLRGWVYGLADARKTVRKQFDDAIARESARS